MVATEARKARRAAAAAAAAAAAEPEKSGGGGDVRASGGGTGNNSAPKQPHQKANAGFARGQPPGAEKSPSPGGDWQCTKCKKSNFARRLACFSCAAPKPGRQFPKAAVDGFLKRQAKREAAEAAKAADGSSAQVGEKRTWDEEGNSAQVGSSKRSKGLGEDGGSGGGGSAQRKKQSAKDKGKPPRTLRDPDAPLVYLEKWLSDRENWKLDKNIQNWLLWHVFDPMRVDEDLFATMLMYIKGLRGGPLERLRESAASEAGAGSSKGAPGAARAAQVLKALEGVGEEGGA